IQRCRCPTDPTGHVDSLSRPRSRTQHSLALRHRAQHDDIGQNSTGRFGSVASGQFHFEVASQLEQAVEEAIHPALWQTAWQGERKKYRLRHPAHGSDVTESARQTTVSHTLGRVPCPSEMDVLQAEISRNQGLMTARDGNHGTIVPDADAREAGTLLCSVHAKPA